MKIGEAIDKMVEHGVKMRRGGWNGKNMFVIYMPPLNVPPIEHLGYFAMFTADKKLQPGWLASQSDLLADDWEVAE